MSDQVAARFGADSGFIGIQAHTGNVAFANIRIRVKQLENLAEAAGRVEITTQRE
jgi:hypothetical protein